MQFDNFTARRVSYSRGVSYTTCEFVNTDLLTDMLIGGTIGVIVTGIRLYKNRKCKSMIKESFGENIVNGIVIGIASGMFLNILGNLLINCYNYKKIEN